MRDLVQNLKTALLLHGYYVHLFLFFFSFFSSTSFINYKRQNPGDFNRANDLLHGGGGGPVSSNSFGKASSSVKIKGTVERFTAGRHEEEKTTCVQSYHLAGTRTYLRYPPPPRSHSVAVTVRITQIKQVPL